MNRIDITQLFGLFFIAVGVFLAPAWLQILAVGLFVVVVTQALGGNK